MNSAVRFSLYSSNLVASFSIVSSLPSPSVIFSASVGKRSADAPEPTRILMFLLYASSASIGSNIVASILVFRTTVRGVALHLANLRRHRLKMLLRGICGDNAFRSEEHTSELQSRENL